MGGGVGGWMYGYISASILRGLVTEEKRYFGGHCVVQLGNIDVR